MARVKELPAPDGPEMVLDILGDTQDKDYPIFRTDTALDHIDTLCTGELLDVVVCVCVCVCEGERERGGQLLRSHYVLGAVLVFESIPTMWLCVHSHLQHCFR